VARLKHIDWLRGVAVVAMVEWHVLDAWTLPGPDRQGPLWSVVALVGGLAAPLFLFLAGVSLPLAFAAAMDRGLDRRAASWKLQKRGWQIFALAHLFRLQGFLLNPNASWSVLLQPDILNILGLGLVVTAWWYGHAASTWRMLGWIAAPAMAIVLLTPFAHGWRWPTLLPPQLEAYIRPVAGYGIFSLFPWVAMILAGAVAGTAVAHSRATIEQDGRRPMGLIVGGAGLALAGAIGIFLPSPFGNSIFWTTSLSMFLIRTGAMTIALGLAWLWMRRPTAGRWSPLVLFGRTSLFVYWVHVEIAYGVFSAPIHRTLPLGWSLAALAVFAALLIVAAAWWARRDTTRPWVPKHMVARDELRTSKFRQFGMSTLVTT
jgi:uncharacterized membrane protein